MNDTPAPYGYCPVCGGLGRSRERRPNGDARCENGHLYRPVGPSVTTLKVGPEAAELEQLKRELQRMTIKKVLLVDADGLMDRLAQIEQANVDRWQDGYAAAERQIAAWLDKPCGMSGHDAGWCPACSFRTDIASAIRDGAHLPKKGKE